MWVILKSKKNKINFLKQELNNKFKKSCEIYSPKMLIENFKNKKIVKRSQYYGRLCFLFSFGF